MYVCLYVLEGARLQPDAHRGRATSLAPRRFSESTAGGGTAIAWMSPCCLVSNGGTCMPKYINILSVSLSVRSTAAKARRPPGLRCLSEQWSVPVISSGVAVLLLLLLATCRAACRWLPPLLRFQVANCFLSLLSLSSPVQHVDQS